MRGWIETGAVPEYSTDSSDMAGEAIAMRFIGVRPFSIRQLQFTESDTVMSCGLSKRMSPI